MLAALLLSLALNTVQAQNCEFSFDDKNTIVEGTGYKFASKDAVTARFTGFKQNKKTSASNPQVLMKDLKVEVDLFSIDSGNALRDQNLRETLFTGILGDSSVKIQVQKVGDKTIDTVMTLNEKKIPIVFTYTLTKDTLKAEGQFDILKFALNDQVAALKKRCGSLHTGPDGKSVTWTDFKIAVTAPLIKKCQ